MMKHSKNTIILAVICLIIGVTIGFYAGKSKCHHSVAKEAVWFRGRVLTFDNRIVRYTQDAYPTYGNQVWAYEITELTTTSYKERLASELPIVKLTGGTKWNGQGMHQVDPHQVGEDKWIACVDGLREY